MADMKLNKFDKWMSKLLYSLIIAYHHEDYICEDANGNPITMPANVWHKKAFENQR